MNTPVVSVAVDDATVRSLDSIAADLRRETGEAITRSDVVKQALEELIRDYHCSGQESE